MKNYLKVYYVFQFVSRVTGHPRSIRTYAIQFSGIEYSEKSVLFEFIIYLTIL